MAKNIVKCEKREIHTVRTWIIARKLTKEENEKVTWKDLEYGEKY
jgi:hypothetical protein